MFVPAVLVNSFSILTKEASTRTKHSCGISQIIPHLDALSVGVAHCCIKMQ